MALLATSDLLRAFAAHLEGSNRIDVAVAWLGPSRALSAVLRTIVSRPPERQLEVRVVVGLSGSGTSPVALRSLQQAGAHIRIGNSTSGIFHPKLYLFHKPDRTACWVGSSNFTQPGFAQNAELIHEFIDDKTAAQWFDDLWNSLPHDPTEAINKYAQNWKRPRPTPGRQGPPPGVLNGGLPGLLRRATSWPAYVAALRGCDAYWRGHASFSVLGDEWSWMDTIAHGNEIACRTDWGALAPDERKILFGAGTQDAGGAWGLLGTMRGAARAVGIFYRNAALRQRVRRALQPVMDAENEEQFLVAAAAAIAAISGQVGFGPAIATRLIALARPDRGVSVNGGSAPRLSELTGLPATAPLLGNPTQYAELLQWVYQRPWYRVAEPDDGFEQTLWSMRAALIDSFVYHHP